MKLLYSAEITPSNKTLTVPFGVKRCKLRCSSQNPIIIDVGPISSAPINTSTSVEFPIINGKSPNTYNVIRWNRDPYHLRICGRVRRYARPGIFYEGGGCQ